MVWFAFSVQDQVEKYGAYVGIAAFFGLAVLSLLYFSQARELKRLREWAGRAPERARELEQRVVAQATATVARRPPAVPSAKPAGGIVPPRRLAEMPAPAAQTAAGAQATELAEAVEADPATNGNVPPVGPGGTVPAGPPANGSVPSDATQVVPPPEGAEATPNGVAPAVRAADDDAAPGAVAGEGAGAGAGEDAREGAAGDAGAREGAGAGAAAAAVGAAGAGAAAAGAAGASGAVGAPAGAGAGAGGGAGATRDDTGEASVPGEIPPATASPVPRATPAQRVGVTPRPQPLRQAQPSATPRGRTPAGRRPGAAQPPKTGRSGGTIALLVGLAVLILGGGTWLVSQLVGGGEDDTPPAENRTAPPPTETQEPGGGNGGNQPAEPSPPAETNVAVLNGTVSTGLAGTLADQLTAEGYVRDVVETNTRDQTIQESTVYYADGERATAREVGKVLKIDTIEPLDPETESLAPEADIVVLAGADQAP